MSVITVGIPQVLKCRFWTARTLAPLQRKVTCESESPLLLALFLSTNYIISLVGGPILIACTARLRQAAHEAADARTWMDGRTEV